MWTLDRIDTLKSLWSAGRSAAIIACELGVTRNAVIGKVHRLQEAGEFDTFPRPPGPPVVRLPSGPARKAPAARPPKPPAEPRTKPAKPRRATLLRQMGMDVVPATPAQARPEQLAAERSTAWTRAEVRAPGERPCTLIELTHDRCRWPLGDPAAESFRYCGGARAHKSYCAHHGALAYQPRR
ncbi:GcrA family cell cycle regulator [Rhodoplanes sp. TEM]|uniref:GcrA family cell cycle regulator n=1 Tax=Rhodoplanes tepidamans TaxID=200616 RepID=A0ABT5JEF8_RHOTP|nr:MULTISPECIES: GcrA family cell cycle regulator [Rhodoplanes]MDC7787992.1 GcrA family cell cycle regulator [Rhodoplanes tepidamans]MDC7984832.1 GcrA family cell cycle regulator [Rhodoplanes sp. TEM]MDQ0358421.1 GcrA cell cycle regulator [Rhodoplanes tepidamans]